MTTETGLFMFTETEQRLARRARDLETVARVSQAINTLLDVDTLLTEVSDLTKDQFELYHAHIYLLDDADHRLRVVGGAGEAGRHMKAVRHSIAMTHQHSLVAATARTRRSTIVNDVTIAPDFLPNPALPDTRSEMAVPILLGDTLIGVLDVQANTPDRFDDNDAQVLQILASQIAVAVQNANSFTGLQNAQAETQILYEISTGMNEARSEGDILDAIVRVAGAISPDVTSVTLTVWQYYDHARAETIRVAAEWRRDDQPTLTNVELPIAYYPPADLMRPDQIVVCDDIHTAAALDAMTAASFEALEIVAYIFAPLVNHDVWVGNLAFQSSTPRRHNQFELRLMRLLSEQVTTALERAHYSRDAMRSISELQTVADLSAAAAAILDLDELLNAVVTKTRDDFRLYHAQVYLLDANGESLVLASGSGLAGKTMVERHHAIALNHEHSLVARAARTRQSTRSNDVTMEPDFLPNVLLPETRSELSVPLIIADTLVGVLDIQATFLDRFDDGDIRLFTTLAAQIAVAVQNARAYRQREMLLQLAEAQAVRERATAERERSNAERLREVDRLKSQFLANMSHELRTPLNSIIGYSELLLDGDDGALTDDAVEDVQTIYQSGQHLLLLINDILDLAKIEAGQMTINRAPLDVLQMADDVLHTFEIFLKDKPVELKLVRDANVPMLNADALRVRQVLTNLVSNAIKFTETGSITLSVGINDADEAVIGVTDTGMGIAKDDLKLIFEQFRQVDGSSTRRAGGTGLGLTISRYLINMHGGDISVDSTLGVGSSFRFTLPLSEKVAVEA